MRIIKVRWIPGYADAITLPPFGIYVEADDWDNPRLLLHEKGHWAQYEEWGFFKYYWTICWQYLRYGPKNAPVERDADRRGLAL